MRYEAGSGRRSLRGRYREAGPVDGDRSLFDYVAGGAAGRQADCHAHLARLLADAGDPAYAVHAA